MPRLEAGSCSGCVAEGPLESSGTAKMQVGVPD
jgi:hypothetical protein